MASTEVLSLVSGIATAVNTTKPGVKLDSTDTWHNVSRFADPAPQLPRKGQRVQLSLDKSGFIRHILIHPDDQAQELRPLADDAPTSPGVAVQVAIPRDVQIARQVALKASVDYYSGPKSNASAEHVTKTARYFLEFLLEPWQPELKGGNGDDAS